MRDFIPLAVFAALLFVVFTGAADGILEGPAQKQSRLETRTMPTIPSLAKIDRLRERLAKTKDRRLAAARRQLLREYKDERKQRFPARRYTPSEDAINLIKSFEGFFPEPYNDPAGHATIGYGRLLHYGPVTAADRKRWGRITEKTAEAMLAHDLERNYAPAVRGLGVGIRQGEGDAALSMAYNLGPGVLGTGFTFGRQLRKGRYRSAAASMMLYVKAGGQTLPGLVRRRRAERKLFRS